MMDDISQNQSRTLIDQQTITESDMIMEFDRSQIHEQPNIPQF